MRKIANTSELQQELRRLLQYAAAYRPSRSLLASKLLGLSQRVATEVSSEAAKAKQRFDKSKKTLSALEALEKKLENGDASAKKKFSKGYDDLFASGEAAAKAGKKLLEKYEDSADEAVIEWLDHCLRQWESNKMHHYSVGAGASEKMDQARGTYAAAQQVDAIVKAFDKLLEDPDTTLDESWRK